MIDAKPYLDEELNRSDLGDNIPKRGGIITPRLSKIFLKLLGWKTVGEIPNITQAVLLAVPHTSNYDALYALSSIYSLDFGVKIIGKKGLFKNPVMAKFMTWSGVIPIDRQKKGSVLQATIDKFKTGEPLFLALAPEGTRSYTEEWKSGFYYIAVGAGVPILPVAMDYKSKELRFMKLFHPTGDYQADLAEILSMYKGVVPKDPASLSQPLQDVNK